MELKIPRDRLGQFSSKLFEKYARDDGFASKAILKMFDLGMTNTDIANLVEDLYSQKYSRTNYAILSVEKYSVFKEIC